MGTIIARDRLCDFYRRLLCDLSRHMVVIYPVPKSRRRGRACPSRNGLRSAVLIFKKRSCRGESVARKGLQRQQFLRSAVERIKKGKAKTTKRKTTLRGGADAPRSNDASQSALAFGAGWKPALQRRFARCMGLFLLQLRSLTKKTGGSYEQ